MGRRPEGFGATRSWSPFQDILVGFKQADEGLGRGALLAQALQLHLTTARNLATNPPGTSAKIHIIVQPGVGVDRAALEGSKAEVLAEARRAIDED